MLFICLVMLANTTGSINVLQMQTSLGVVCHGYASIVLWLFACVVLMCSIIPCAAGYLCGICCRTDPLVLYAWKRRLCSKVFFFGPLCVCLVCGVIFCQSVSKIPAKSAKLSCKAPKITCTFSRTVRLCHSSRKTESISINHYLISTVLKLPISKSRPWFSARAKPNPTARNIRVKVDILVNTKLTAHISNLHSAHTHS